MLLSGDYYTGKTLSEKMSIIHSFLESGSYKYLLIIDLNRCDDVISKIQDGVYPVRITFDIDNKNEIIAYTPYNMNAPTKSIYVYRYLDPDAIGIIEHCAPMIGIFS
jgi:hypothetical protein